MRKKVTAGLLVVAGALAFLASGALPLANGQEKSSPPKWEFRAVAFGNDEKENTRRLNELAQEDWEYVGPLGNGMVAFRRPRIARPQAGLVQGNCRARHISGVPGDPKPFGPWRPRAGLRIVARDEMGQEVGATVSGPDGRYRLSLPPGRYTVFGVEATVSNPPARVGGRPAADNRGIIEVRPGATVDVDFDISDLGV